MEGKIGGEWDTCICLAELLCCSPEIITTLLISYTPIQNKKLFVCFFLKISTILIYPVHPKGDQSWVFIGRTDVEADAPILWPPDAKS